MTPEAFVERVRALDDLSSGDTVSKHEWQTIRGWMAEVSTGWQTSGLLTHTWPGITAPTYDQRVSTSSNGTS